MADRSVAIHRRKSKDVEFRLDVPWSVWEELHFALLTNIDGMRWKPNDYTSLNVRWESEFKNVDGERTEFRFVRIVAWGNGVDLDIRIPEAEWRDIVTMMSMEPRVEPVDSRMALLLDEE
jgi:hypothetical protein